MDARRPVPYSAISSRAAANGTTKWGVSMPIQATEKIWHNGKWINWDDAKLHVLPHVVSYGSAVFEGIRCYETKQGSAIFRLREHMQRLINSAKIYRMELPFSVDQFASTACELVRLNKLNSCYVRPIVLRGYGEVGVNPLNSPIEIYMACWSWGAYLGPEALSKGVEVGVSRSEEHTSELQSQSNLVCRLLLEKNKPTSTYRWHSAARSHGPRCSGTAGMAGAP